MAQHQPSTGKPKTYLPLTPQLHQYILDVSVNENEILKKLREETSTHEFAVMQIPREEGQFLTLILKLMNAKKTIEVGVFTGYSTLITALALPSDGKIIACDVNEQFTNVGKRYWKEAGVEHKIDLRLAPAVETLDKLISEGHENSFDFAFIDADKVNYDNYYERLLKLIRKGGLIAIDNVLWHGRVVDPQITNDDTVAIRALNQKIKDDKRVTISMIYIADGITLAMKN